MNSELVLAALVFFHHGDYIPDYEFQFSPCGIEPVYISGLNENNVYIQSGDLAFYQDQAIYLLNPDFTSFEIRSMEDDSLVDIIHLRWDTECVREGVSADGEVTTKEDVERWEKEREAKHASKYETKDTEISEIVAPEEIVIAKDENPDIILNDVYAYDQGKDVSYTLTYEPIETNVPGIYKRSLKAKNGLQKDITIKVVEAKEEEPKNIPILDIPLIISILIVIGVAAICLKVLLG